jgi:hypothetical protein
MRTDIFPTFFSLGANGPVAMRTGSPCLLMCQETQKNRLSSNTLTLFDRRLAKILQIYGGQLPKRPELELFAIEAFTARSGFHSFWPLDTVRNDLPLVRL